MWHKETSDRLQYHENKIRDLEKKIKDICDKTTPLSYEEYEFQVRNLENSIANEKFFVHKFKEQLKCDHSWECLGGGGQIMTDICRKCGASFDY